MAEFEYDAIVVGAGPAGEVAAGRIADGGLECAIVERELIGGECSFYACMPSKALLRPGELLGEARRTPGVAEAITGELDVAAALARRDQVIHNGDDSGMLPWLEGKGIALHRGHGRIAGERRVEVGDDVLTARRAVVIATGTASAMPPVPGLDGVEAWDNRPGTTSEEVPASLVILGGGPVGCELAQAWTSLGSRVTLVEVMRLLSREEPFAADQVEAALEAHGVDVRTHSAVGRIGPAANGGVRVELPEDEVIEAERLLVATGRRPHTDDLGLETAGLGLEPGAPIEVDDRLRVAGSDWLYAIGDVNARVALTHAGKYQARACADVICGRESDAWADLIGSPRVTFTDPQVAAVGKTLAEARGQGIDARAVDVKTQGNAGASFHGRDTAGGSRLVIDERRRVVIGATFVGYEVAEMLHAATIAIVAEVPLERLWHAIPAFPTRNEVWLKLLERYGL